MHRVLISQSGRKFLDAKARKVDSCGRSSRCDSTLKLRLYQQVAIAEHVKNHWRSGDRTVTCHKLTEVCAAASCAQHLMHLGCILGLHTANACAAANVGSHFPSTHAPNHRELHRGMRGRGRILTSTIGPPQPRRVFWPVQHVIVVILIVDISNPPLASALASAACLRSSLLCPVQNCQSGLQTRLHPVHIDLEQTSQGQLIWGKFDQRLIEPSNGCSSHQTAWVCT